MEIMPKDFLRGISNSQFVENGIVTYQAFQFDDNPNRNDEMKEASINWLDNEEAVQIALSQKNGNGNTQFPGGVAMLNMDQVKLTLKSIPSNLYGFERAPIDGNQYHGNILIKDSLNKPTRMMIQCGLALAVGSIIPQK